MPPKKPRPQFPNNLRALRKSRGLKLRQVAEALGTTEATISRRESGDRQLKMSDAREMAEFYGVSVNEVASDLAPRTVAVAGYVGAGAEVTPFDDFATGEGIDQVPCPAGFDPDRVVAVRVRGDSMFPMGDGWDLFYRKDVDGVPDNAVGALCVVKLIDGRMFVKHLARGSQKGLFTLISSNGAPMLDQRIRWAAPVLTALPGSLGLAA